MNTVSPFHTNIIADTAETQQNLAANGTANSDESSISQGLIRRDHFTSIYSKVKADPPLAEPFLEPDVDEEKLIVATYDIRCEHLKLFMRVRNFLIEQGVTVKNFVSFLHEVPGYARNSLLSAEIVSKLYKASDLIDVFGSVKEHCSWFNHSLLGLIIDTYCDDNERIKKAHQDYCTHLKEYCEHRIKKLPVTNGYGHGGASDGRNSMIVKVDSEWDAILFKELEEVVFNIAHILGVSRHTLFLCCVEKGCVQLTFMVPNYISDEIFPLTTEQEETLPEIGVTSLHCGNYYFTCQV